MYDFYQTPPEVRRRKVVLPKFIYVKNGLAEKLLNKVTYWRENPRAVRSNHFLVRLLQSIPVSKYTDDRRFVDNVEDMALDLAMSLRMTSPIYRGEAFEHGPFYGRDSVEVLLAHSEDFDVDKSALRWKKLEPIRFLTHPKTDLDLNVPLGEPTGSETGLSVIAINIPMLAFQYKKWWEEELKVRPENPRTVMQFVRMYALPNTLYSQLDIAMFNRQVAIFREQKVISGTSKDPFFTIDYSEKFDAVAEQLFSNLTGRKLYFDEMLDNLLTVAYDSAFEYIRLPEFARTRQVIWALTLARLPYFSYLLELNYRTGSRMNRQELNNLRRFMRRLKMDRDIESALPQYLSMEVKHRLLTEIEAYL